MEKQSEVAILKHKACVMAARSWVSLWFKASSGVIGALSGGILGVILASKPQYLSLEAISCSVLILRTATVID